MYRRILVAVENSPADRTILTHIRQLATLTQAEILLVHVADGWAARNYDQLKLRESEEMRIDRAYLQRLASELTAESLKVEAELAMGDPGDRADTAGIGAQRRSHRDVHARPPLLQRSVARDHRQQGPARRQDPGSVAARAVARCDVSEVDRDSTRRSALCSARCDRDLRYRAHAPRRSEPALSTLRGLARSPFQPRLERSREEFEQLRFADVLRRGARLHGTLFVERTRAAGTANPADDVRLIDVRAEGQLDEIVPPLIEGQREAHALAWTP